MMADNNVEWTSKQMIENASNWSLAGDVALLNSLKKFSESLLSETVSVSDNVDDLLNNLESVSLRLDLVKNEFQGLRNTQFIENRVYEDDETLENNEPKKEEKELTEEDKENAIRESIVTGLKVMEKYFDKVEVTVSDSEEEENEKSYILRPKDPYAERPLPYMIGSQDWYKKWHVGLLLSESESESEKEEEMYSSSDSEECLPKDRVLGSETSSELDFTNRNTGPVANSTFNDSEDCRREIFHSSDESSEQSSSYPVKTPISNQNFAEQLATKLGDVINSTNETPVPTNRNPIKKNSQATKYGNLFSDEPPPLDSLDDTVLPKSAHKGLFSGGKDLFADDADEEIFWGQQNNTISGHNTKEPEVNDSLSSHAADKIKPKVTKGLFDESESSSEEDMFMAAEKRKVKISQPYFQPFKTTLPFVDDQPPDITSKVEVAPSKKKPIGGVSIFGEKTNLFGESSGKPGFETAKTSDTYPKNPEVDSKPVEIKKSPLKKTSLFDDFSDEDIEPLKNKLSQAKKPEMQQNTKKLSLFDDADDVLPSKPEKIDNKPEEKKKLKLFEDDKNATLPTKTETMKNTGEKKKLSLFDDEEDADLFKPPSRENSNKSKISNNEKGKKPIKKISLFDDDDVDDDDFLKEEEDIFTRGPKKKDLFGDFQEKPSKKTSSSLFDDLEADTSSENIPKMTNSSVKNIKDENKSVKSLLEDTEHTKLSANEVTQEKSSSRGLFEDLEADSFLENISKVPNKSVENIDESKQKKSVLEDTEQTKPPVTLLPANEEKQAKRGLFDDLEDDFSVEKTSKMQNSEDNSKKYEDDSKPSNHFKALLEDTEQVESSRESSAHEETHSQKSSGGLFDDMEAKSSSETISRLPSNEENLEKKPVVSLFEDLNTGSSGNLFGDSKNTTAYSNEHLTKEAVKEQELSKDNLLGRVESAVTLEKSEERDKEDIFSSAKKKRPVQIIFDDDANSEDEEAIFKRVHIGKSTKISKGSLFNEEHDADKNSFENVNNSGEIRDDLEQFSHANRETVVSKKDITEDVLKSESEVNKTDLNIVKSNENTTNEQTEHSESILRETKESFLGKIRKNVGFADSDSDTASDDNSEPSNTANQAPSYKNTIEEAAIDDPHSFAPDQSKSFEQTSQNNSGPSSIHEPPPNIAEVPKIYTVPPPIDLFDPNPPPPDPNWDAASDNSSNSDTFSLTDGILDRTNFTQSQARSSLFDEAPPSLDANESSGIVRDLNVTRVETDDSSFYPYASSSRRLSSDIFIEQQSQDSFFVTKNRTDLSAQHGSSLGRIPEDTSSKIKEITPSGSFGDFEESSVFERTDDDSKNERNMTDITPNSDIRKPQELKRTSIFEKTQNETSVEANVLKKTPIFEKTQNEIGIEANVKKNVKLFEESPEKEDKSFTSPIKTSPGKLKHNLNINVGALMPGAAQPKFRPALDKSHSLDETDKSAQSISAVGGASERPPLISRPARPKSELFGDKVGDILGKDDGHFEKLHNTEVLPSATKDRARIPVKRRPSTRKARQEAVRKSMTDFSLYQNEEGSSIMEEQPRKEELSQNSTSSPKKSFLEDLNSKMRLDNSVLKQKATEVEEIADKREESPEVRGISLVFGSTTEISSVSQSEDISNLSSSILKRSIVEVEDSRSTGMKQSEEPKSVFEDSLKKEDSLFGTAKTLVKKNTSLFGAEGSDSSDEDLFSSTKKSSQIDKVFSSSKSEETSSKIEQKKTSIFSDKSGSESEGELFGNLPKVPGVMSTKKILVESSKKGSLFDDLEDSEDELFGSKTSKSGSSTGDSTENKGFLGQRRTESKNVRVAAVKKLENKEVTDFDPLSALK